MTQIQAFDEENKSRPITVDRFPGKCPLCRRVVSLALIKAYYRWDWKTQLNLQIIFRCPEKDCANAFIAYYIQKGSDCFLDHLKPQAPIRENFPRIISWFSKSFIEIYNQAYLAEQTELIDVAGAGYRRAFEFLIKDYLITKNLRDEKKYRNLFSEGFDVDKSILRPRSLTVQNNIRKMFLGKLIDTRIMSKQIKELAKRAAWLGNDATHYEKRWLDKDLSDLKTMIHWTIKWIDNDESTIKLIESMPEI